MFDEGEAEINAVTCELLGTDSLKPMLSKSLKIEHNTDSITISGSWSDISASYSKFHNFLTSAYSDKNTTEKTARTSLSASSHKPPSAISKRPPTKCTNSRKGVPDKKLSGQRATETSPKKDNIVCDEKDTNIIKIDSSSAKNKVNKLESTVENKKHLIPLDRSTSKTSSSSPPALKTIKNSEVTKSCLRSENKKFPAKVTSKTSKSLVEGAASNLAANIVRQTSCEKGAGGRVSRSCWSQPNSNLATSDGNTMEVEAKLWEYLTKCGEGLKIEKKHKVTISKCDSKFSSGYVSVMIQSIASGAHHNVSSSSAASELRNKLESIKHETNFKAVRVNPNEPRVKLAIAEIQSLYSHVVTEANREVNFFGHRSVIDCVASDFAQMTLSKKG